MIRLDLEHEVRATPEGYWSRCLLSRAHNEALFLSELKACRYSLQAEQTRPDGKVERLVLVEPQAPAGTPDFIRKALAYEEVGILDRVLDVYSFQTRNVMYPYAVDVTGEIRAVPRARVPGGKLDAIVLCSTVAISVRLFGVGGMVESQLAAEIRRAFKASADFSNAWLAAHP